MPDERVHTARTILGVKRHITRLGPPVKLRVVCGGEETSADLRVFLMSETPDKLKDKCLEEAAQLCKKGGGKIVICKWRK